MNISIEQNEQLRDDMRDLQRQLDAQRETMLSKQDGDKEVAKKIKDKNVLLNAALDENRVKTHFCFAILIFSFFFRNESIDFEILFV